MPTIKERVKSKMPTIKEFDKNEAKKNTKNEKPQKSTHQTNDGR